MSAEHEEVHSEMYYVKIWGLLLILLVVSIIGPEIGIPIVTLITAFGIAIVKTFFVCRDFMHLNVQPRYVVYMLGTMVAFMVLLFMFVAPDVMKHSGQRWKNCHAQKEVRETLAEQKMPKPKTVAPASKRAELRGKANAPIASLASKTDVADLLAAAACQDKKKTAKASPKPTQ